MGGGVTMKWILEWKKAAGQAKKETKCNWNGVKKIVVVRGGSKQQRGGSR
jgi:hypothetical protein